VAADFASGILNSIVFPAGVDLVIQWDDSVGQPIGDHAESSEFESFELADFLNQSKYSWLLGIGWFLRP
jgi:hypothetical protein